MMKIHAKPPRPEAAEPPSRPTAAIDGAVVVIGRAVAVGLLLLAAAGSAAAQSAVYRCGNEYTPHAVQPGQGGRRAGPARDRGAARRGRARSRRPRRQLADDMARDRRRAEAANRPRPRVSLGPARPAASATAKASAPKPKSKAQEARAAAPTASDFVADVPAAKTVRPRLGCRRAGRLGLQPPVLRPERLASTRRAPGSTGMQSTGQTCTHCGSSKWPTHSVQRFGSMT